MDQRTTYEIIIAGKLETLPIPDMADQIWNRIQGQLDLDMPTDDDTPGPAGGSPVIPGLGWGLLIFVGALITLFFLGRNNNEVIPAPIQTIEPFKNEEAVPVIKPPSSQGNIMTTIDRPPGNSPGIQVPKEQDSILNFGQTPVYIDSNNIAQQPPITEDPMPAPVVSSPDTTVKKKRGVAGVNDSDYRIVPKKGQ